MACTFISRDAADLGHIVGLEGDDLGRLSYVRRAQPKGFDELDQAVDGFIADHAEAFERLAEL